MIAERRSAGHQLVHHGAERPNITGHDGLGLATETLRSHICQGAATLFCSLGSADGAAHSGTDSEIGNQIVALVVYHNVIGLYILMNQWRSLFMQVGKSSCHVMQHFPAFIFRDVLPLGKILEGGAILDVRHDQVGLLIENVVMCGP